MKRWILVVVSLWLLSAVSYAGDVDLGYRGGYMRMPDADDGAGMVGAFLRFALGEDVLLDTAIYYHDEELSEDVSLELIPIQLSLMLYLLGTDGPVRPFMLGGCGVYWTRTTENGVRSDSEYDFGGHLGAGMDFALSERMFIEADFRYIWLDAETEGNTLSDVAHDYEHWVAGIALAFRLGR
ncbi:MAG: outer membrane beta-barrel protein [Verrucomicrobia bacterium]|jgi:opacity protein-like surface antigen|nr:outer membrane beta-barrel protein [Verrucomicrobiota bacterium]